jgi:thiol-disulfide isomerase/thioredoxin
MQKVIVGVAIGAVVLAGGWYLMNGDSNEEARTMAEKAVMDEKQQMEEKAMMEKEAMEKAPMTDDATMMDKDEVMMKDEMKKDDMKKEDMVDGAAMMDKKDEAMSDTVAGKAGVYAPYEASKLAMANDGDVVLFFKASWCPSCRALDADIKASLTEIPAGLTILEVDYDTATAMKQQYGVTTQHTLIQVDASGTLIKKWSGGSTLESVVAQVK